MVLIEDKGKYLQVMKKIDGEWKCVAINIIMGYVGRSNPEQLLSYAKKAGINDGEDFISIL